MPAVTTPMPPQCLIVVTVCVAGCGCVVVWLCGCVAVWLRGCGIVAPSVDFLVASDGPTAVVEPAVRAQLAFAKRTVARLADGIDKLRDTRQLLQARRKACTDELAALSEQRQDIDQQHRRHTHQLATLRERLGADAPAVDDPAVMAAAAARRKLVQHMRRMRRLAVLVDALDVQAAATKVRVALCVWLCLCLCLCLCLWLWLCGCGCGCACVPVPVCLLVVLNATVLNQGVGA